MAEKKRTEFEAERDREEIGRRYLRGESQQTITDYLNKTYYADNPISRQQISYDVRLIIDRWVKASINHVDQKKALELAKVDHVEATAWDGYEDTAKPIFLEIVLKCIAQRCAILGIEAPKGIDITSKGEAIKAFIGVSPDDWSDNDAAK